MAPQVERMRILSLDGGGVRGLATAAFLAEAERHWGRTCYDSFDLFCGTSTGSILALGLASGIRAERLVSLYEEFAPRVFYTPTRLHGWARSVRQLFRSKYSNDALRESLSAEFGDRTLGHLRAAGKHVIITAYSLSTGRPRVFKTDHAPHLSTDDGYRIVDIALASSAAPVYLPAVALKSPTTGEFQRYVDGGIVANNPALLGLAEALHEFNARPRDIRLLSVSTPRPSAFNMHGASAGRWGSQLSRGAVSWGSELVDIIIGSGVTMQQELIRRLVSGFEHPPYCDRVELIDPVGLTLDDATPRSMNTLKTLGVDAARGASARDQLREFFHP
jgi:patatin-like phospholipase/acyl hydrolase